jgi:tRNA U34 5-carboxymethylaminomethyl modifying GTPase MnmE/TrmE
MFQDVAGTEAIVFVVGNKTDLLETQPQNAVDIAAIHEWATESDYLFFETSAVTGDGIKELLDHLAMEIARRQLRPKGKVEVAILPPSTGCC